MRFQSFQSGGRVRQLLIDVFARRHPRLGNHHVDVRPAPSLTVSSVTAATALAAGPFFCNIPCAALGHRRTPGERREARRVGADLFAERLHQQPQLLLGLRQIVNHRLAAVAGSPHDLVDRSCLSRRPAIAAIVAN